MNPVHFSSQTDLWETPADLFSALDEEFGFETDVCALPSNAKCTRFFTPAEDGLTQAWTGVCYMNPPYGRQIGLWVRRAYESSRDGAVVVCLLPARTDTAWWHRYVTRASEVRFLRGRLRFGGGEHPAPFPSVIVVFRPDDDGNVMSRWACYRMTPALVRPAPTRGSGIG
jgi:phage N-6-adenine-methyltransferase